MGDGDQRVQGTRLIAAGACVPAWLSAPTSHSRAHVLLLRPGRAAAITRRAPPCPAGDKFALPVFAPSGGGTLQYDFKEANGYSLNFSVRQDSVGEVAFRKDVDRGKGSCSIPSAGLVTVTFDNSQSWMYSRELTYEVVLLVEDETEAIKRALSQRRKIKRRRPFPCCCLTRPADDGVETQELDLLVSPAGGVAR